MQVELALAEIGVKVRSCQVDFRNKPEWYARANPMTGQASNVANVGSLTQLIINLTGAFDRIWRAGNRTR